MTQHTSTEGATFQDDTADVIDLDVLAGTPPSEIAECTCGTRRSNLRYFAVSPCASRAASRLKAAHPDEYKRYLADEKAAALAQFEAKWLEHLNGNHSNRY